ncbi:MAG: hypothetical protein IPO40_11975 [Fibrobacteres bacterium]|nr:hypothetical protein [Fibrobacterota bacterium]
MALQNQRRSETPAKRKTVSKAFAKAKKPGAAKDVIQITDFSSPFGDLLSNSLAGGLQDASRQDRK